MVFMLGRIDKNTGSKLGEQIGTIVFRSLLLCYYIGYELASGKMARSDGTAYLVVATEPIDELILNLLGLLVGNDMISKEEGSKRVIEIADLTGKAANDVCILGIKYFSKIKFI